ncbi:MAG: diguanylate cyclase, partial [Gammaproteobacteria bacterium]|nr:diguanylate cyclase [Gammaproteobacteria bacterium]
MVSEIDRNHQDLQLASLVFENTSEGIIIINDKYEIISINRAFTNITGYTEEEVIGKNPSILNSGNHDKKFFRDMWQSIKKTGQWNGEIHNKKKDGEIYTELLNVNTFKDIKGNLTYYIGVFTDISNIKETENKLEYLAHHDPLTDLPNRLLCHARMSHELQMAKRNKQQVAVLFLDLDMFKIVNDSMGHAKGDLLLQLVAQRINDSIRDEDTIARLGGDEFTIITGSLKSRQDAALVAENTLELFSTPFTIDDQEVFIGVSIGISIFPDDGENPDVLLRNADAAMYRAKSEGRNNYQFYTPALTKKAAERLNIETCLRQAMDKNEFQLYYQPQWSLSSE